MKSDPNVFSKSPEIVSYVSALILKPRNMYQILVHRHYFRLQHNNPNQSPNVTALPPMNHPLMRLYLKVSLKC